MTTNNNQTNHVIIITGNDTRLDNILSIIQKSVHRGELNNVTTARYTMPVVKRRKTDLTCLICENRCSGYNFNVISCKSCKSFFHRNMSQNMNDLKCLSNTNNCNITIRNQRRMCRRCRLAKCLSVGMKRNCTDEEEKLNKHRELEENRQLTINTTKQYAQENIELNPDDYNRLKSIKLCYKRGFEFVAMKHDISEFCHIVDQRSALLHLTANAYDIGMRLVTFIRNIPEFELLNDQDRFILVKHNSPLVFFMHQCLNYDMNRDLVIDVNVENEEYATITKQWAKLCCGEQLCLQACQLFHSIKKIINDDSTILQLLMVVLLFSKNVSFEDVAMNEHSLLFDSKQVYAAQSIYTNLLFRYMIEKYSNYHQAVRQYSQLMHKVVQMIMIVWRYRQVLEQKLIDTQDNEINPIVKSILRLH